MSIFVINEATTMCCGQPKGKCICKREQASYKPVPLGLPVWNFDQTSPAQTGETVVTITNEASEGGLGLPVWNFEQPAPEEPAENYETTSCESPLGLPVWEF